MIYHRPAAERGNANFGWLDSHHSFSFGHYYDSQHMGWSVLRVINDDTVDPGAGFGTHGHRDMEIISYVLEGALHHRDSTGRESVLRAGEVQRMTAGSGIRHSEFNHSSSEPVHFLQIWILPNQRNLEPGYEQQAIERQDTAQQGKLTPLVSPDCRGGSLKIHQDMVLSRLQLKADENVELPTSSRAGYLHLISGKMNALIPDHGTIVLSKADGLGINGEAGLALKATADSVALWFDLPAMAN